MKHVSVVGLGYIGLPTALIAATHGYKVLGFDVNKHKITLINQGVCPIEEPGLEQLLHDTLEQQTFHAHTTLQPADFFVVAVPTPFNIRTHSTPLHFAPDVAKALPDTQGKCNEPNNLEQINSVRSERSQMNTNANQTCTKQADLTYVFAAARTIGEVISDGNTVILESTIPVGTTQQFAQMIEHTSGLKQGIDFYVAHCPERVLPGKILHELQHNDRVIGGMSKQATIKAKEFYQAFVSGACHLTDDKTAEMVKLIENSSRDVQIALANEIAGMCKQTNINPFSVIELANKHPRVNLLQPGCGVGGHCIAVDPWFLIEQFPAHTTLLQSARMINDTKPHNIIADIIDAATMFKNEHNRIPRVLVCGLTFKANVDDLRESPALLIAQTLQQEKNVSLKICEPHVKKKILREFGFSRITTLHQGLKRTDIVVILVKHDSFKTISSEHLARKIVIDPCGMIHETTVSSQRHN